jgi:hypothetical protein
VKSRNELHSTSEVAVCVTERDTSAVYAPKAMSQKARCGAGPTPRAGSPTCGRA